MNAWQNGRGRADFPGAPARPGTQILAVPGGIDLTPAPPPPPPAPVPGPELPPGFPGFPPVPTGQANGGGNPGQGGNDAANGQPPG